jgi:DNA-binding response OmpR family regulator
LTFNDEEPIKLSPKENELLKMLILHENDLMPREGFDKKYGETITISHLVWMYIAKLRKYLKLDDNVEILNIHGEGFLSCQKVEKKKKLREIGAFFCFSLFVQKINLQSLI